MTLSPVNVLEHPKFAASLLMCSSFIRHGLEVVGPLSRTRLREPHSRHKRYTLTVLGGLNRRGHLGGSHYFYYVCSDITTTCHTLSNVQREEARALHQYIDNRNRKLRVELRLITYTFGWYNVGTVGSFSGRGDLWVVLEAGDWWVVLEAGNWWVVLEVENWWVVLEVVCCALIERIKVDPGLLSLSKLLGFLIMGGKFNG